MPATRQGAQRLGLVTLEHMVQALLSAIESPVEGIRILGVPEIRDLRPAAGAKARIAV
jgi:hypothetical protein